MIGVARDDPEPRVIGLRSEETCVITTEDKGQVTGQVMNQVMNQVTSQVIDHVTDHVINYVIKSCT